jgi:protein-S-isoprenylcysteine O-methyltransferase Ste14
MAREFLHWYLAAFAAASFLTTVVLRSWLTRRRAQLSQTVNLRLQRSTGNAVMVVGQFMLQTLTGVHVVMFTRHSHRYEWLGPLEAFETLGWTLGGLVATLIGWGVVWAAQSQLGASWRMGVDDIEGCELKTHGLYRYVRHPIYSGIATIQIGLFLLMPTIASAAIGAAYIALLQIEMLREEAHFRSVQGNIYSRYMSLTGRWLPRWRVSIVSADPMTLPFPQSTERSIRRAA